MVCIVKCIANCNAYLIDISHNDTSYLVIGQYIYKNKATIHMVNIPGREKSDNIFLQGANPSNCHLVKIWD